MQSDEELGFPTGHDDERELLLAWLRYLRGAVLRNLDGLDERQVRWTPDGKLISLLGMINHLTNVEWRWIDGGFLGAEVSREESEFSPGASLSLVDARGRYHEREASTETAVRALELDAPHADGQGRDLRWVLLHLINETARHAGHADATGELLDGAVGE